MSVSAAEESPCPQRFGVFLVRAVACHVLPSGTSMPSRSI
jgi:hypothetical protein